MSSSFIIGTAWRLNHSGHNLFFNILISKHWTTIFMFNHIIYDWFCLLITKRTVNIGSFLHSSLRLFMTQGYILCFFCFSYLILRTIILLYFLVFVRNATIWTIRFPFATGGNSVFCETFSHAVACRRWQRTQLTSNSVVCYHFPVVCFYEILVRDS